jgi:hypothetical protein
MYLSHLSLKIRARYGDLVRTVDRRSPNDAGDDLIEQPVPHTRTLLPRLRFPRWRKKAAASGA